MHDELFSFIALNCEMQETQLRGTDEILVSVPNKDIGMYFSSNLSSRVFTSDVCVSQRNVICTPLIQRTSGYRI
jgi:hypothetical protein